MESYKIRWQGLTSGVTPRKSNQSTNEYCKLLKACREGDYLVKVSKNNNWSGMGCDYVQFDYGLHNGGVAFGRRSEAAWFTKEEASEFVKWAGKGFKFVKLSKNKH